MTNHFLYKRREFITLLGGVAAAWPFAVRAQQPAMPVIGFFSIGWLPATSVDRLRAFRQGLRESGYVEGENVSIEYRWADQSDRLPEIAAELIRRRIAVIVAPATPAALAAKAATTTIPIVFATGFDPVTLGLVASLARPGGNLTGINFLNNELAAKQLELLHELVPTATRFAALVNPFNPANAMNTSTALAELKLAASARGLQIQVLNASTSREIDAAFATFLHDRPDGLFVSGDGFYTSRRAQMVQLTTTLHKIPTTFANRDFAEVGGLMSYGANVTDAWRHAGVYAGRVLKGAKPADLPVVQSTKLELVVNAQTARMLGIAVPSSLLSVADEVIE